MAHPLPRGGTDLMTRIKCDWEQETKSQILFDSHWHGADLKSKIQQSIPELLLQSTKSLNDFFLGRVSPIFDDSLATHYYISNRGPRN
jgi:hypothetical protein